MAQTLAELTTRLADLDPAASIYAVPPWTPASPAIIAVEPANRSLPPPAASLHCRYFLEVFIAREVLEGWNGTPEEACHRLIRYAETDA